MFDAIHMFKFIYYALPSETWLVQFIYSRTDLYIHKKIPAADPQKHNLHIPQSVWVADWKTGAEGSQRCQLKRSALRRS